MSSETQPGPQTQQQNGTRGAIVSILLLVVIVGGGVGALMAFSDKEGEDCKGSAWGCARGLLCVDEGDTERCRRSCKDDADCNKGESCDSLIVIGSDDDLSICNK